MRLPGNTVIGKHPVASIHDTFTGHVTTNAIGSAAFLGMRLLVAGEALLTKVGHALLACRNGVWIVAGTAPHSIAADRFTAAFAELLHISCCLDSSAAATCKNKVGCKRGKGIPGAVHG